MDSHPECTLCVHRANWEVGGVLEPRGCQCEKSFDLSLEDSIRNGGLYIATASFLYRPELVQERPVWRRLASIGDFPLQLLCGLKGTVHFLADTMCVYRYRREGSWSDQHQTLTAGYSRNEIEWMTALDNSTNHEYSSAIYSFLYRYYRFLFLNREISFTEYWRNAKKSDVYSWKRVIKDYIKVLFHLV